MNAGSGIALNGANVEWTGGDKFTEAEKDNVYKVPAITLRGAPLVGPQDKDISEEKGAVIPTERLYPASSEVSPILHTALRLLAEAFGLAEEAVVSQKSGEFIKANDNVLHIETLLPELFCCRSIGDGFGAVVNAITCGLENVADQPLREEQMRALVRAFRQLHDQPFMAFDDAVVLVMMLEDAGFVVEPKGFHHLANWIDEEGNR